MSRRSSTHLWLSPIALVLFLNSGCSGGAPARPNGAGGSPGDGTPGSGGDAATGTGGDTGAPAGSGGAPSVTGGRTGTSTGGASASGGRGGSGGAVSNGGTGGATTSCGSLGQACCATGSSCATDLICLGAKSCSCIKDLFDWYLLRSDGKLLYQADPPTPNQTPVLDAATAQALTQVTGAVGGSGYGCAIRGTTKEAWCWREAAAGNNQGQLGSGTMEASGPLYRATPVLTAANQPLTGVDQLFSNHDSVNPATCALVAGQILCWGDLTWLVNQGTATASPYATRLTLDGTAPVTGAVHLSFNRETACAVLQVSGANSVWCWGDNREGQLGQGDVMVRRYPTRVMGIASPTRVAVTGTANTMACAVDGDGVKCWGYNAQGYSGTGRPDATVLAPSPVLKMDGVTPLSGIVDLRAIQAASYGGFCGVTAANTLLCWGESERRSYPDLYLAPNLVSLGYISYQQGGVRYLSSDGLYHYGTMTKIPDCGPIQ